MKHNWSVTFLLVGMFLLAQVIGLAVINSYVDVQKTAETGRVEWKALPSVAGIGIERPEAPPMTSAVYIFIALVIGTMLLLVIIRWQKVVLWKLWFWLAVVLCLHIAFSAFMPSSYAVLLALILGTWKIFRPGVLVHNATELFIYGGLAVIFVPLLTPLTAIILLLLISAYDMYAVWRSKHMTRMAQFQAKTGIFAGLLLPYLPKKIVLKAPEKPGSVRTAILGGGDIGFPLIFAGVVMKTAGLQQSVIVAICATIALLCLLLYGQKKKFYPAMPFLTIGCLIGYGLLFLM
ncbi:MAG: presenilin family intramembrane aspartyl protease [Candidatus Woesearchaeota archaeon]